jgi:TolB-like protein
MSNEGILRSWKEISRYLGCDRKTSARWETECGLPVRRIDTESSRSRVFAYQSELDQWLAHKQVSSMPAREGRGLRGFVFPAAAVVLVLAAGLILKSTGILFSTPRIPVLTILSTVPPGSLEQDYILAEGFRREIQRRLSASGRLQVTRSPSGAVSKASIWTALDSSVRPDFVLESSLRRQNDRPELSVLLRRRQNEKVVWSDSYDNPLNGLNACLNDVCGHIFNVLKIAPPKRGERAGELTDYSAYESYLTGHFLLARIAGEGEDPWTLFNQATYYSFLDDEEANQLALKLFNQVLQMNPRFAPAMLGLAQCYINNVNLGVDLDFRCLSRAENMIRQAEAIDPHLPDYFRLRIQILLLRDVLQGGDSSQSYFALADRGFNIYPRDAALNSIIGYCWFLKFGRDGREEDFDKALKFKRRAFWGNPCSMANYVYAEFLMLEGEFDEALRVCSLIQPGPNSYPVDNRMAEIYFYKGELDKSEAILLRHTNPRSDITSRYLLGMIAAGRKDIAAARQIAAEIDRLHPPKGSPFQDMLWYASIFAGIGETAEAEEIVRTFFSDKKTEDMRFIHKRYMDINPNFKSLATQVIVARKGGGENG